MKNLLYCTDFSINSQLKLRRVDICKAICNRRGEVASPVVQRPKWVLMCEQRVGRPNPYEESSIYVPR